jgi:hypothetical protein
MSLKIAGLAVLAAIVIAAAFLPNNNTTQLPGGLFGLKATAGSAALPGRSGPMCDACCWRNSTASERKSVMKSIVAQLDAFKKDDYAHAVVYQSSELKQHFARVDTFRTMMIRNYPQFAHYKSVTFGAARTEPGGHMVEIMAHVTGEDGMKADGLYIMKLEDGLYRVASVEGGRNTFHAARQNVRTL